MEKKNLLEYPYEKRKIIKIRENGPDYTNILLNSNQSLPMKFVNKLLKKSINSTNYLSIEIRHVHSALFPNDGIPQIGKVYICNPIDSRRYYEVHNFHEQMINHKIYEAEYFLRSLGAIRIEVENISDIEKKKNGETSYNSDFKGNLKNSSNFSKRVKWSSTYTPIEKPIIPTDLFWYELEDQWKSLANARLNSGIESFDLEIEITEDFGIDSNILIPLKEGNYITADLDIKEFKKSIFRFSGVFSPL